MALATRGPNFCKPDVVRHDWELAKELGLNITVHVAMDRFGYTKMQITDASRHGPAVPEHDLRPRLALHRRGVGARARLRRQRLVRPADRGPDGPRLGARGDRPRVRHPDRPVAPTSRPPRRRTSSPRCARSSARSAAASTRRPGTPTSTASRRRRGLITVAPGPVAGRPSAGPRSPASPTGPARSRPASRPTSSSSTASAVNVAPIIDPVGAVVCAADVSNVKTVIVDGEILKEDFRLKASLDARARPSRRRATTSSRSSATRSPAGWSRPPRSVVRGRAPIVHGFGPQDDHGRHRSPEGRPRRVVIAESESSGLEGRPRHVVGRPDGVPRLRVDVRGIPSTRRMDLGERCVPPAGRRCAHRRERQLPDRSSPGGMGRPGAILRADHAASHGEGRDPRPRGRQRRRDRRASWAVAGCRSPVTVAGPQRSGAVRGAHNSQELLQ